MTINCPLRFGILGNAEIFRRRFLPALGPSSVARMALVGSRHRNQPHDFPVASYEEVVKAPEIDIVYIPLPNHLHEEWTSRALRAGKHVICEKPLGLDLAAVQRMLAIARAEGRLLYENIMYLHHPQHRQIREMVRSGTIGTIRQLHASFCFTHTRNDDFRLDPLAGGGSFQDQARYPLTAALYHLTGNLSTFQGVARFRNGLDMAVVGSAISSADELFTFTIAFDQPYEAYYEIIGEKGRIRLDRAYTTPADMVNEIRIATGLDQETRPVAAADHFQLMIEYVCGLIATGQFEQEHRQIEQRAVLAEEMRKGCIGSKS